MTLARDVETVAVDTGASRRQQPVLAVVFCVFLGVYLTTWGAHYTTGDGAVKRAWSHALLRGGGIDIDPAAPGVQVSKYGIGHSLVAVVPAALAGAADPAFGIRSEMLLYTLLFVVNGATLVTMAAAYGRRHTGARSAWTIAALIGLGTTWWPHTKMDFTEPLVATALLGGFLLVRSGRVALGMTVAGFCGLLRPDAFLLVAWLGAWVLWTRGPSMRRVAGVVVPTACAVALHVATTYWRYGTPWATYPNESFSTPAMDGLWGLLLSPGKSVFLYSPPLVLGVAGLLRAKHVSRERFVDAIFFAGVLAVQVCVYCRWWDWSGDDAWGPRFLLPGAVLATIPAIHVLDRKRLVALVMACGLTVQLCAVIVSPLDFIMMVRSSEGWRPGQFGAGASRVGLDDLRFNPRFSPIAGHVVLVGHLLGWVPASPPGAPETGMGTTLYEAFPASAWESTARWDPVLVRAGRCGVARAPGDTFRQCVLR